MTMTNFPWWYVPAVWAALMLAGAWWQDRRRARRRMRSRAAWDVPSDVSAADVAALYADLVRQSPLVDTMNQFADSMRELQRSIGSGASMSEAASAMRDIQKTIGGV